MIPRELLKEYIDKGLISEQVHPDNSNVCIYNYTNRCQFSQAWDEVTMRCRGLIIDWTNVQSNEPGTPLSNPFPKFFNYEEYIEQGHTLPLEVPIVTEKADGWLGILYWLDGKPWIATRGSFESIGAVWATEWLRKYVDETAIDPRYTYLFEIISPITKIVVNYDYEGLVLIGVRKIRVSYGSPDLAFPPQLLLKETPPSYGVQKSDGVRRVAEFPWWNTFEEFKKLERPNEEGFVFHWPGHGFRLKLKFDEYKRLHKILTNVSEKSVWEALRDGQSFDEYLRDVPDEFYKWVTSVKEKLEDEFDEVVTQAVKDWKHCCVIPEAEGKSRKEIAEMVKKTKYPGIVFAMHDGKDYKQMIWRLLKPKATKAFKEDG